MVDEKQIRDSILAGMKNYHPEVQEFISKRLRGIYNGTIKNEWTELLCISVGLDFSNGGQNFDEFMEYYLK